MKKYIIALLGLTMLSHGQLSARIIPIPVDSIFNHLSDISEIMVIGYVGDSVMKYIDTESHDTLKFDCKSKKYSEFSTKTMEENDSK